METEELPTTQNQKIKPTSKGAKLALILLALILIVGVAIGVYYWQHGKVTTLNDKVNNLQSQLTKASTTNSAPQAQQTQKQTTADTFTYSPKTGGLTLVLPKKYAVVVNVDGNKGGAPGARFRIVTANDANTFTDSSYQGIQIDIDNTFTTLNKAVTAKESELTDSKIASNFKVTDTTVAGIPAKLITADGSDEYVGGLSYYIFGSGSFEYTITVNGTQHDAMPDTLSTTLKGLTIKSVTL